MADDKKDRIEEIRSLRSKRRAGNITAQQHAQQQMVRHQTQRAPNVEKVSGTGTPGVGSVTGGKPSPWLHDRVTLSLEAQIAMIEMRATQRLTLADMGYNNRLKVISIRPGIFLKAEPTGCYRMMYNNRV